MILRTRRTQRFLIGIAPCRRGFGFAVLSGTGLLHDWGMARVHARDASRFEDRLRRLLQKYQPSVVLIEEALTTRRPGYGGRRVVAVTRCCNDMQVPLELHSARAIRQALSLAETARFYRVALETVRVFPALARHMPKARRFGQGVDERIYVFEAAALVATQRIMAARISREHLAA